MSSKAVRVIGGLLLAGAAAGCSTTVPGTPVADPSAAPKPDTGSYATKPRTIDPMTEKVAKDAGELNAR